MPEPPDPPLPLTAEQRRYLSGPLVLHNPGWADCVPDWLITAIPAARLEQVTAEVAGETERDLATLEEVCAYLYTASLAFPLDRDYTAIFLWSTTQALSRQGRVPSVEVVFEMLGEIGAHDRTLTAYQEREVLRVLRRDIRRSVTRHARAPKP
jgi:hypothetical protein